MYKIDDWIEVNDLMQSDYRYRLIAPMGEDFDSAFNPHFSPKEMLKLGVFEGKYMNDCWDEFPADWYEEAKLSDEALNYFEVKSRQNLDVWQKKDWIYGADIRGWFQWYCRYYLGRREPEIDQIQVKRWRAFVRHAGQIRANCDPGNFLCRPRQRQGLLQWSHDPFI